MADGKNKIIIYRDWLTTFEALQDDEAGKLVKHLFRYVNDLNPEPPDRLTALLFEPIKQALKRDLKRYEEICSKNKDNVSIRWQDKDTTEYERNDANTNYTDIDIDKDIKKKGVQGENKDELLIKKIEIEPEFEKTFLRWLQYKRKRGESYKDKDSTFLAYKKLFKLSGGDLPKAKRIIEQSMANNWAGLFELKEEFKTPAKKQNHPSFYDDNSIPYHWNEDKQRYISPGGMEWVGAPLR